MKGIGGKGIIPYSNKLKKIKINKSITLFHTSLKERGRILEEGKVLNSNFPPEEWIMHLK